MTPRSLVIPLVLAVLGNVSAFSQASDTPLALLASADADPTGVSSIIATAGPGGASYNVRIATDASPDLTDLDSFIHSTTSHWPNARDKVWSLFYWTHKLRRQTSPMLLHGHEVTDPVMNFQDFGFTMCSTVSGINQVLYEHLGLRHQYWDICNHTVAQVEYDGKFHMVDNSYSNLVTTDDGVTLASLQEAAANSARLVKERGLYVSSPNGFLTGSDTLRPVPDATLPDGSVRKGYASSFCETGLKLRDEYYNWNAGHRYVLNLRENETYTRYYQPLAETAGAEDPREYWVSSEKIGTRAPTDTHQIDRDNKFGNRGNGRWIFTPSLATGEWERAAHSASNITRGSAGLQAASAAAAGEIIYKVQGANAIASQRISAQFAVNSVAANATVALSRNLGQTWVDVGSVSQQTGTVPLTISLRDPVNGLYETLVRVRLNAGAGGSAAAIALTALTIETITGLNAHALPKLNVGRNEIFVGLGDQTDTMRLWPDLRSASWQQDAFASSNIAARSTGAIDRPIVYPSVFTQDAQLTYRMNAPGDLTRIVYGGRLYNRAAGSYIAFLHSFDNGTTWTESYRYSGTAKPYDVIHYEAVDVPAGVRSVRFKYLIHNTGTSTTTASGLYSVRMAANYLPRTSQTAPVEVTLRWAEVRADRTTVQRSHKQVVNSFPARYVVNVGGRDHPAMQSMTVNVTGAGDGTPAGYSDGVDVGGTKHVPSRRTEGVQFATNRPYTISRAPSGFQGSAGATNTTILTDGIVGSPLTGDISYLWAQCWTSGSDVNLQLDLGTARAIGAFRAHLQGYPGWNALKGEVQDTVEVLTSSDGITFTSQGFLQTSLWKKDVPVNYILQDDGRATGWNFQLTVPSAVNARYVKYRLTPRRNTCVTELQVLSGITYQPFGTLAAPAWIGGGNQAPTVALTSPQAGASKPAPATFSLAADASDDGSVIGVEFLANGAVIGQDATAPYTFTWQNVPEGQYSLAARARDNTGQSTTSAPVSVKVTPATSPAYDPDEIVVHAGLNPQIIGAWSVVADATAASGKRVQNPNAGAAKQETPLAAPTRAFELAFYAEPDRPYRIWLRGKATSNHYNNDSVYLQFDHSVNSAGTPIWRINSTEATTVILEDCNGCGLAEWGWNDNGYGPGVLGDVVYFDTAGWQRVRIQAREDGLGIDQLVLSAVTYGSAAPGTTKNDTTSLPATPAPPATPPGVDEIVLYAAADAQITGGWTVTNDSTAATGARLQNPDEGVAKVTTPLATPTKAFDITFNADAGKAYRLWVRGKAVSNHYNNDSVFVQFDHTVDGSGTPTWRIGTTSATSVILEDCGGCGLQGWGWADNGYGTTGVVVTFATAGSQRLRVQAREDGLGIDQIVLSAVRHFSTSPGSTKNDTVILPR